MENKIRELLEPTINELGYKLDKVEYVKEDKNYFLRIYIDKNEGITIEDCVIVSKQINPILDEKDLIEEAYILDVCSK